MSHQIAAFGEILWDMLPSGKQLGGAPGNFAYHSHVLGSDVMVISQVGNDVLGREITAELNKRNIPVDFIGIDLERPTGTVEVELDRMGHPAYQIIEDVAWDGIKPSRAAFLYATEVDAICFGSLAMRGEENRVSFSSLINGVPGRALRVLDLNLREPFYTEKTLRSLLSVCNVLKLNDDELIILAGILNKEFRPETFFDEGGAETVTLSSGARAFIDSLIDYYSLKYCILTCGAKGSFLLDGSGILSRLESTPVKVASTVGAGDAFTAVCVNGFLNGDDPVEIHRRAVRYAAYVCTQPGAMPPVTPEQLKEWGFKSGE
ncbi:MAG: carbohydrate kinase [Thermoguttaceae bacterium]|nr:carbohydrate kinase [Thermoguttaceae bacterium]MCR5359420.1 carbohydrate kinase [Thermoguttaceae bacterium]